MARDALKKPGFNMDDDRDQDGPPRGQDDQPEHGRDRSVTFDQFDLKNYLHADIKADGSASEQFIFQVTGLELHGAHVGLPGLGSKFGMYFIVDASLVPSSGGPPTFTKLDIRLMADPGNNNGALSATTAGIGFANGTADDVTLATGSLVSAQLSINAIPLPNTRHANFVEQIAPTEEGREVFGNSLAVGDQLRELLTTLGSDPPHHIIPLAGGASTVLVNGGIGTAQLVSGQAMTLSTEELLPGHGHGGSWGLG